jgi:LPXTG-site transpeptidase (sortase) family protein
MSKPKKLKKSSKKTKKSRSSLHISPVQSNRSIKRSPIKTKRSLKKSKKVRRSLFSRFFQLISEGKLFIILGILLLLISGIYHVYEITKYSFTTPPPVKTNIKRTPVPIHIAIDQTTMDFPIIETVIQHGVWQVADDGASHLNISARPGENGTIIIYAHNLLSRFGSLPYVSIGQKVTLTTADKKKHVYIIKKTQVVDPNDTKVLVSQKGEVLLMYTCYGFADLQRFMVFAYPEK